MKCNGKNGPQDVLESSENVGQKLRDRDSQDNVVSVKHSS